jgi:hypothetical protein
VDNKVAPEGSIEEGCTSYELVAFCSMHLQNAPTVHNRPQRNPDEAKGAITRMNLRQMHNDAVFNSDKFL